VNALKANRFVSFDCKELMNTVLPSVDVAERSRVCRVTEYEWDAVHEVCVEDVLRTEQRKTMCMNWVYVKVCTCVYVCLCVCACILKHTNKTEYLQEETDCLDPLVQYRLHKSYYSVKFYYLKNTCIS